jgi:hypothetical protein
VNIKTQTTSTFVVWGIEFKDAGGASQGVKNYRRKILEDCSAEKGFFS